MIHNNSAVRLWLLETVLINDEIIPANTLCTGVALLSSNRLVIIITALKLSTEFISTVLRDAQAILKFNNTLKNSFTSNLNANWNIKDLSPYLDSKTYSAAKRFKFL